MFEVGKSVVAIKDHSIFAYRQGDVFEVEAIKKGCVHSPINLMLSPSPTSASTRCNICGIANNGAWFAAQNFRPLEEIEISALTEILECQPA